MQDHKEFSVSFPHSLRSLWFNKECEMNVLWYIVGAILVLWFLGFIGHILGGLIHLLLVVALVLVIVRLIQGKKVF